VISWISFFFYRSLFIPSALFILRVARSFVPEKIQTMIEERESPNWTQLPSRPIWIHASSGEIEYAKPLIRSIKERWPQRVILVTYFSPSAKKLFKSLGNVDAVIPLPWDDKKKVKQFLAHFKPEIFLIARTDVWPEFAYQTRKAGIPSILFAATFATESKRQGLFSSPLTRFAFNQLSLIDCVSEEDAAGIRHVGTRTEIQVTGDTRYDQVLWRLQNPVPLSQEFTPPVVASFAGQEKKRVVFVAGSTWPQDEAVILPALVEFTKTHGRVILAPHEVSPERIQKLAEKLKDLGLSCLIYSHACEWPETASSAEVLLIDQIGSLQEIYAWGDIAFVGGSFKDKVHSVMEPLAAGLPVMVGPLHSNNREALHFQHVLIEKKPAVQVVSDSDDVRQALLQWNLQNLTTVRGPLKAKVSAKAGATHQLLKQIAEFLEPSA
jgi:3-deoxy-D-manno-octulosonic-acid transferase